MSQENVEIVRAAVDAYGREGIDGVSDHWTEDIDHRAAEGAIDDRGPIHGKDAMRAYMQDWIDTFDDFRTEAVELIDAGDDKVIAMLRASGRAKLSGVETDVTYAVVYTIRDGKVARGREYMTLEEALETLGLSEYAMSQESIEVVRTYFKLWNAGDMEGVRELYGPDAVMEAMPDRPEPGPFVGRDAVMQELNHVRAAFDSDSVEFLSDLVAVGDRVIVRTGWHGSGRGPQSDMEWTTVSTIRDGRILNVQYFWDHAEALEAAGLSE